MKRALSPAERWYWVADQVSPLNVLARVHVRGTIAPGLLERAAMALAAEHPLLRVAIASDVDGTNPEFVPTAGVCRIRRVRGDETEWERQVNEYELPTSVDWRSGPLLRIVDVAVNSTAEEHDLILTASHVIADGTTALTLLQRLLEHADLLAVNEMIGELVTSRPELGPPEDHLPSAYHGTRGAGKVVISGLADLLAGTFGTRPSRLTPEIPVPATQRRTRLVRRTLSTAQVESLTRRCREEGVTVHGALAAAMALSIGPVVAKRSSGRICIGSPVDVRNDLVPAVSPDEAGAYVCTVPSIVRFGAGVDVWSAAHQINRSLERSKRIGQPFALLAALRFMSPVSVRKSRRAFAMLEQFGPGNVCISNLGRHQFPERIGGWQLSGAQFMSGVSVSGYLAATVNTSHGELSWNFNHIDTAVSHESAQRLADDCVQTVLDAVATPVRPAQRRRCAMDAISPARPKSVVITGASSGLGRAAALHLGKLGYRVYAGVRTEFSAAELAADSQLCGDVIPVLLDVTDAASIARVGERIRRECADTGLYAVVNNAGVSISAPLECIPIDAVRSELETNLVGTIAVTQHFLPLLRVSKGRIVNISSGVGSIAPPYLSIYAASQFAKEGLSDSLRRELRQFGVSVSVIQPGAVHTPIWDKMAQSADEILDGAPAEVVDVYRNKFVGFLNMNAERAQKSTTTPEDYADTVAAVLAAKHPKARYRVGLDSWSSAIARRILPDRVMDTVMAAGLKTMARSATPQRTEVRR